VVIDPDLLPGVPAAGGVITAFILAIRPDHCAVAEIIIIGGSLAPARLEHWFAMQFLARGGRLILSAQAGKAKQPVSFRPAPPGYLPAAWQQS
jgi:hypothetical protein